MNINGRGRHFILVFIFAIFILSAGASKCDRDGSNKSCIDLDKDGYCANFAPRFDCDDNDPNNWSSCESCIDQDGDGFRGAGCDKTEDCDDDNPNVWADCGKCEDKDGDGWFAGCQDYQSIPGPDCDDADPNNFQSCDTCRDQDRDGYYDGCDFYLTIQGPDCDDADPDNWGSCAACADADGDGYKGTDCDIPQDCNDRNPNVWSNCGLETTILSGPPNPTNTTDANFAFNCNLESCSFSCQMDIGAWKKCTSPRNYRELADGAHIFNVRAVDANGNQDITPASYAWLIDSTPPDTFITGFPENPTRSQEAVFVFNCNESACVFECSLDNGNFAPCESPAKYGILSHGPHAFAVRAIDALGNIDPTPAVYNWNADLDGYWRTDTILHLLPDPRSGHTAVWTGTEMIIWGGKGNDSLYTGARYNPATDTWASMSTANAPHGRVEHTAVWTGAEMIIWGGYYYNKSGNDVYFQSGGRYNPATNSWISTSEINAPSPRYWHTAVWTGQEMIVWGGRDASYFGFNSGGRYDPGKDLWKNTSTLNAPAAMAGLVAVWTGREMIVWRGGTYPFGRYNPESDSWTASSITDWPYGNESTTAVWTGNEMLVWSGSSGGRYNPSTDEWLTISLLHAPKRSRGFTAVWTGNEMIVWGGAPPLFSPRPSPPIGSRYNPLTDSWTATASANEPSERTNHTAVWTGTEMIVWGGGMANTGGRYNPITDSWAPTQTYNMPTERHDHTTIWTGTKMIILGGRAEGRSAGMIMMLLYPNLSGDIYDPATDSWTSISTINEPLHRENHSAIWTGTEMIIWGGQSETRAVRGRPYPPCENTGGRYNPATDSWVVTSIVNTPSSRFDHTAVWTGTDMIVWGGYDGAELNTGGKYNPDSDSWTAITIDAAPSPRRYHTAIWIGSRMIVWGGGQYLNTGGLYDPVRDRWSAASATNAPSPRKGHSAIWTGTEMVVWGGNDGSYINSGGRYDPALDSWKSTTTANGPSARTNHSAVWTGKEMIIWGGGTNTGGKYNPSTNSWIPTATMDAPSARSLHSAVWTGAEMIIWGGGTNTGGRYIP